MSLKSGSKMKVRRNVIDWYVAPFEGYHFKYCTIPEFMRPWFDKRFHDLCAKHDRRYVNWRSGKVTKWQADMAFCVGMVKRRKRYIPLAFGAMFFFATIGQIFWYTDKLCNPLKCFW